MICIALLAGWLWGADTVTTPFRGVTLVDRVETEPRGIHAHLVTVDLREPGVSVRVTGPGGRRETIRQTTLEFLREAGAQVAVNAHFFLPFPSADKEAWLVGFAASEGRVFSAFEKPKQRYALVKDAPAIGFDRAGRAVVLHRGRSGRATRERFEVWNAVAGSAQIVTGGVRTIPRYSTGELKRGGPRKYSDEKSWYDVRTARTAIGISRDGWMLWLFTADARGGSAGMTGGEVAEMLIREGVFEALNLDGGGSTTLAMEDPATHERRVVNTPSDANGLRKVASSLAVFAPAR